MSEALRQHYLNALGIVQYVPRDAPAADFDQELPQNADAVPASFEDAPALNEMPQEVKQVVSPRRHLADLDLETERKPEPVIQPKVASSDVEIAEPQKRIELRLALWQLGDDMLICSELEGQVPQRGEMQLLGNILQAIGRGDYPLPPFDVIEWPPANLPAAGGELEVRDFMHTLLQARLSQRPVRHLLLMGEDLQRWVLPQASDLSENQRFADAQVLHTPSLPKMLQTPLRKRDAWQVLRTLC